MVLLYQMRNFPLHTKNILRGFLVVFSLVVVTVKQIHFYYFGTDISIHLFQKKYLFHFEMDLFTVDTVGEHDLVDRGESDNSQILYTNHRFVESNKDESEHDEDEDEDVDEDDDQETEEDYDYGGKNRIVDSNFYSSIF